MVVVTTIVAITGTIYFKDGAIFQDFPSNFLMFIFGNKQTKPDHYTKLDKITNNVQPIKRFVQKTKNDSQTHKS